MTESLAASAGRVLRVHTPSRLAFAGTTLALVSLASLATAVLVGETTSAVPGAGAPQVRPLPPLVSRGSTGIVVDRVPGTFALARPRLTPAVAAPVLGGGTALLPPAPTGGAARTSVLRGVVGVAQPVSAPVAPPALPPEVAPPVVAPVAQPPAAQPPAVDPTVPVVLPPAVRVVLAEARAARGKHGGRGRPAAKARNAQRKAAKGQRTRR